MSGTMDIKPAFQVEKIEGTFYRTVIKFDEDVKVISNGTSEKKIITRKMVPVKEAYEDMYMVYFPQGHSICIAADDTEQLMRVGVLERPPLVDMISGEIVPDDLNLTPKEIVERRTRNRPRPATRGGIAEALEG